MRLARPRDVRAVEIRDRVLTRLLLTNQNPPAARVQELIYAIVYEVLAHIEAE